MSFPGEVSGGRPLEASEKSRIWYLVLVTLSAKSSWPENWRVSSAYDRISHFRFLGCCSTCGCEKENLQVPM